MHYLIESYSSRICEVFGGMTPARVLRGLPFWQFEQFCQIVDEHLERGTRG